MAAESRSEEDLSRFLADQEARYLAKMQEEFSLGNRLAYARFLAEMGGKERKEEALAMYSAVLSMAADGGDEDRSRLADAAAWSAVALEADKQYDAAEERFKQALELVPSHPLALGNYAMFMHKVRKRKGEAAKLFVQAMNEHPNHTSILVKFASFKKACGDLDGAEALFDRATQPPGDQNGEALGAYAVFLHAVRQDAERAEAMYSRSVEADDSHANNLSNFGLFLADVRQDFRRSESMYKLALEAEPGHANAAYNYAVLLDSSLKDTVRAEEMYRQVIESDPKHGFALYNLAVLLEEQAHQREKNGEAEVQGWMDNVLEYYRKAAKAAPKDALSRADLGRFLLVRVKDANAAIRELNAALELDPDNAVGLYHRGLYYADKKKDMDSAKRHWVQLLEVDPNHVNCRRRLARLAVAAKDFSEADQHYQAALKSAKQNDILAELVHEIQSTMSDAPSSCGTSRALAEQIRRRKNLGGK